MPSNNRRRRTSTEVVDPLADESDTAPAEPALHLVLNAEPAQAPVAESPLPERPLPEGELTAEQRRIRELENLLALERGKKDPEVEYDTVNEGSEDNILIHFLVDGSTALGHVWYRGQELEFDPAGQAYKDTCDRLGRSWLELRNDDFAQMRRFGEVRFRSGPWPGEPLTAAANAKFEKLRPEKNGMPAPAPPSAEELERAAQQEAARRRAAPRLPLR